METGFTGIILMGGSGERLGGGIPKQFRDLGGKKTYLHALQTFLDSSLFDEVILVCHPDWIAQVHQETSARVVPGGKTRQESSLLGLRACLPKTRYVIIHDAVRPFVSENILRANVEAVIASNAANTCISSADTIVHATLPGTIDKIPPRKEFLRGQTPQSFSYRLILEAHEATSRKDTSDDCCLVLDLNHPVTIVPGEEQNFKITTHWDWRIAEMVYQNSSSLRNLKVDPDSAVAPIPIF